MLVHYILLRLYFYAVLITINSLHLPASDYENSKATEHIHNYINSLISLACMSSTHEMSIIMEKKNCHANVECKSAITQLSLTRRCTEEVVQQVSRCQQ